MTTLSFTNGDDTYTVVGTDTYDLSFRDGSDLLNVKGGTFTTAHMGTGDDVAFLRSGDASVLGDAGNDRFEIYRSGIEADGGDGTDTFNVRQGNNLKLTGGLGDDRFSFFADSSALTASGGDGKDVFIGNGHALSGNIYGGAGNDRFQSFSTADGGVLALYGGAGNDVYRYDTPNPGVFVEKAGEGIDTVQVERGHSYTLPANIENLIVVTLGQTLGYPATLAGNVLNNNITGGDSVDTLLGYFGADRLSANGGADSLYGGEGNDQLYGGERNDSLFGEDGEDRLNGGAGDDSMAGGNGDDLYYVDSTQDTITESAGGGVDTIRNSADNYVMAAEIENGIAQVSDIHFYGNSLDNVMSGTTGHDLLSGEAGNDIVKGGNGDDYVAGWTGDDTIYGGDGDDDLEGQDGDDILVGGLGQDVLRTGAGKDIIRFEQTFDALFDSSGTLHNDLAVDFDLSFDRFQFTLVDGDTTQDGKQPFHFTGTTFDGTPGDIWLVPDGNGGDGYYLYAEVNDDDFADMAIQLYLPGGAESFTMGNLII